MSITRNTLKGWYELEIGLPNTWVFDENDKISCEILIENESGKVIKIIPKTTNIVVDDLIEFVKIIIKTNEMITLKEKEFTNTMQEMKENLEEKAKNYYKELDELRKSSFQKAKQKFSDKLNSDIQPIDVKKTRGRPKSSTNKKTKIVDSIKE